ncbi:MAG: hypothetical protein COA42_23995 [Alteromonadaceae bacterium]|nr:MAG: hypothetical protein COA42_23995 [Alteromonadaceae bacterium]
MNKAWFLKILALTSFFFPTVGGSETLFDVVVGTKIGIELAVDLNGDGKVGFPALGVNSILVNTQDVTTQENPFRFWLNNDFDVVVDKGVTLLSKTECSAESLSVGDCTIDDVHDRFSSTNSTGRYRSRIESTRDLEDFFPLAIKVTPWGDQLLSQAKLKIWLRSSGAEINVFKGTWNDSGTSFADDYLRLEDQAREQVKELGSHVGDTYGVTSAEMKSYGFKVFFLGVNDFDENGMANFIVEVAKNNSLCGTSNGDCFIEAILMDKNNAPIVAHKVFTDFRPIKDFYTHMTAGTEVPRIEPEFVKPKPFFPVHLANARISSDSNNFTYQNNVVLVHGWRMPARERVMFGETAFKRLYWQGFRGNFILASWPTGWFDLPSYAWTADKLIRLSTAPQNYDNSEAIARRSGVLLKDYLSSLPSDRTSVIAHSMGNVVVSEALKSADGQIVQTYVASQAAEAAGAYDINVPDMEYLGGIFSFAWQAANILEPTARDFGIAPDRYRFTFNSTHGLELGVQSLTHYDGLRGKAGEIINFSNRFDAALEAWKLNQVTKPGGVGLAIGSNPTKWTYRYTPVDANPLTDTITDVFAIDPPGLLNSFVTTWGVENPAFDPAGIGNPEYLAHIIPGRTDPLGHHLAARGEVSSVVDLSAAPYSYNRTGYDHSAQFLHANAGRNTCYWAAALEALVGDGTSRDFRRSICQ